MRRFKEGDLILCGKETALRRPYGSEQYKFKPGQLLQINNIFHDGDLSFFNWVGWSKPHSFILLDKAI